MRKKLLYFLAIFSILFSLSSHQVFADGACDELGSGYAATPTGYTNNSTFFSVCAVETGSYTVDVVYGGSVLKTFTIHAPTSTSGQDPVNIQVPGNVTISGSGDVFLIMKDNGGTTLNTAIADPSKLSNPNPTGILCPTGPKISPRANVNKLDVSVCVEAAGDYTIDILDDEGNKLSSQQITVSDPALAASGVETYVLSSSSLPDGGAVTFVLKRSGQAIAQRVEAVSNFNFTLPTQGNIPFSEFNPLKIGQSDEGGEVVDLSTPGAIISRIFTYGIPLAGMLLFVMIVWGGFEIVSKAATKKSVDAGKQRVTAAIIGFLLLFSSYWIAQLIEVMFGITIFY